MNAKAIHLRVGLNPGSREANKTFSWSVNICDTVIYPPEAILGTTGLSGSVVCEMIMA